MSTSKLSEPETQARAMQWLDSLSREEWQARLDAADQVFGRTEASTTKPVVSVRRTKSPKAPKKILHKVG